MTVVEPMSGSGAHAQSASADPVILGLAAVLLLGAIAVLAFVNRKRLGQNKLAMQRFLPRLKLTGMSFAIIVAILPIGLSEISPQGLIATQDPLLWRLIAIIVALGLVVAIAVVELGADPKLATETPDSLPVSASDMVDRVDAYNKALAREFVFQTGKAERLASSLFAKLGSEDRGSAESATSAARRFTTQQWQAQRLFQDAVLKDDTEKARTRIDTYLSKPAGEPVGVWIIGSAGAGKTTLLHRAYFELIEQRVRDASCPAPLLIEPRRLTSSTDIEALENSQTGQDLLRAILTRWVEHREREGLDRLDPDALLTAIKEGQIILLIDGYDELQRLRLQAHLAAEIRGMRFDYPVRYLIASRPEIVEAQIAPGEQVIELESQWSVQTAHRYIEDVFAEALPSQQACRTILLEHLDAQGRKSWLRTPRMLAILIEHAKAQDAETLSKVLDSGSSEYELLETFVGKAIERALQLQDRQDVQPADILSLFKKIARDCALSGIHQTTDLSAVHELASKADELLQTRRVEDGGESVQFSFSFTNPNFLDFFLAGEIANALEKPELWRQAFDSRWSASLTGYLAAEIAGRKTVGWDGRLVRLAQAGQVAPDTAADSSQTPAILRAANAVETALKLSMLKAGAREIGKSSRWGDLSRHYLAGADLSSATFTSVDFRQAILTHCDFRHATFKDCDFDGAQLAFTNASGAQFENCRFGADAEPNQNRVFPELLLEGAEFRNCGEVDLLWFTKRGATGARSRYRGNFQKLFAQRQAELTGGDSLRAAQDYADRVLRALQSEASNNPEGLLLLDLMAGGSNPALMEALLSFDTAPLSVIAIDKDTSQLKELAGFQPGGADGSTGPKFEAQEHEINGRIDLRRVIEKALRNDERSEADIIIAKKALHEIDRKLQPGLISDIGAALRPGGRFVLYLDGPPDMGDENRKRLEVWRQLLLNDAATRTLDSEISSAIEAALLPGEVLFEPTLEDYGLFANIWVLLKDWANGNDHELKNRYFSSAAEVTEWSKEAGLEPAQEADTGFVYLLAPERFNERGLRRTHDYLESAKPLKPNPDRVAELLESSPRLKFLRQFTRRHLWDPSTDRATPFGTLVEAYTDDINLSAFDPIFPDLEEQSLGFAFPVSIMALVKTVS